jgi:fibronectin-binding autotransporter adhesin
LITINSGGAMNVDASAGFSANTNASGATISLAGQLNFIDPTYAPSCPPSCNGAQITGGGAIALNGGSLNWASNMYFETDNAITGHGTLSGGTIGTTPFTLLSGGSITPTGLITINSDLNNDGTIGVGTGNTLVINGAGGIGNNNSASILVNGGTLTEAKYMDVGIATGSTGTLTINSGGTANITGDLNVGVFAASGLTGVVTVSGAGSSLGIGGNLAVGNFGTGSVSVLAGGFMSSATGVISAGSTVLINGPSSEWQTSSVVDNYGSVTVSGGTAAHAAEIITGGNFNNYGGSVTVGALSLLNTSGNAYGDSGTTLVAGTLDAGAYNENGGTTTVSGTINANSYLQQSGGAQTTVQSGGNVDVSAFIENAGVVDIQGGGNVTAGTYMVNGGITEVYGTLGPAAAVTVANGATLVGDGTITGSLTNSGLISPQAATGGPGTLTVNGSVTLTGTSQFDELIASATSFGQLAESSINLGGTLDIELLGSYLPTLGTTFTFIDPGAVTGTFAALELNNVSGPLTFNGGTEEFLVEYNASNVELCVESTGATSCATTTSAVPEPSSIVLLATVLLAFGWYMRKRHGKASRSLGA